MIEGLFAVNFTASAGSFGRGVVLFTPEGQVYGGDADYFYKGALQGHEDEVNGRISVANHSGTRNSVFGPVTSFTLNVSGRASGNSFTLVGEVVEMPGTRLSIRCRKVSELN